jgi:hypothetical protein
LLFARSLLHYPTIALRRFGDWLFIEMMMNCVTSVTKRRDWRLERKKEKKNVYFCN